jgi:hypothetical protein
MTTLRRDRAAARVFAHVRVTRMMMIRRTSDQMTRFATTSTGEIPASRWK